MMGAYLKESAYYNHCLLNELENGLVVPGKITAFTKSAATGQKLKEGITHLHEKELCNHMDMEITRSDLKGKKLFIFTDSDVVEA